jgi:hypothetical protein
MSKIIEVFIRFSDAEWKTLTSKHTEVEIKWLISKASDEAIALECEKINDADFYITTNEEDEAV